MSRIMKYFKLKSSTIVRHFRDSHTMILISLVILVLPLLTASCRRSATPIVGRDRESVVMYQMSTKEELFTDVQTFKFFMGTYNVNGQRPDRHLKDWLAGITISTTSSHRHFLRILVDEDAPDLYAIGFQELDLSKEAFVFMESEREAEWTMVVSG